MTQFCFGNCVMRLFYVLMVLRLLVGHWFLLYLTVKVLKGSSTTVTLMILPLEFVYLIIKSFANDSYFIKLISVYNQVSSLNLLLVTPVMGVTLSLVFVLLL